MPRSATASLSLSLWILLVLLLTAGPASARDWYVAVTGRDRPSCGTDRSPCATIAYVDRHKVSPGDTVHVLPGSYRLTGASCIVTRTSGMPGAPITWQSQGKWGAKILGNAACLYLWHNFGDYVNIRGFDLTGTIPQSGPVNEGGPVAILNEAGNTEIADNHIHHLPSHLVAAIDNAGYTKINNNVHDNVIHDLGYDVYPARDPQGGYAIYQATPGSVYNNVIYRTAGIGISCWHAATNLLIHNNTIVGARNAGIQIGTGDEGAAANAWFDVANNIVVTSDRGIMMEVGSPGSISPHTSFRNNLIHRNQTDWQYTNDPAGRTMSIQAAGFYVTGTLNQDPKFVSAENDDYRLAAGSVAIGGGAIVSGDLRSASPGRPPDIGALPFADQNVRTQGH